MPPSAQPREREWQYEAEVKYLFQRQGSVLRQTVRIKDGIIGSSTTFQKIGKGTASVKARHGVITPMNRDHTAIPCTLADFYAGDWVDKLDEAKTNIDERMAIAQGGVWALGRKVDDQIITALGTTTQTASNWTVSSQNAVRNSGSPETLKPGAPHEHPLDAPQKPQ